MDVPRGPFDLEVGCTGRLLDNVVWADVDDGAGLDIVRVGEVEVLLELDHPQELPESVGGVFEVVSFNFI